MECPSCKVRLPSAFFRPSQWRMWPDEPVTWQFKQCKACDGLMPMEAWSWYAAQPKPPPKSPRSGQTKSSAEGRPGQQGSAQARPGPSQAQQGRPPSPPKSAPPPKVNNTAMSFAAARECLGLTVPDPTMEQVRTAYKQAALKWHPDRKPNHGKEAEATKKFQEACAAFELLRRAAGGS